MTGAMHVVCIGPANVEIPFRRSALRFLAGWARFLALPEGKHDLATYMVRPGMERDEYVLVVERKQRVAIRFTARSEIQYKPAGSALNVAMGFVKLGVSTQLVTSLVNVPHDDLSGRIRMYALGNQIQVVEVPRPLTPITFIIVDGDSDGHEKSTVLSYKPSYVIENDAAERALWKIRQESATHVLATGIRVPELALVREAFQHARQQGAMTCFIPNASILVPHPRKIRRQLARVMPYVDVWQMNEREAETFLGKRAGTFSPSRDLARIREVLGNVRAVIVTRGVRGALAMVQGEYHEVAAYPAVPKAVDTTGAGDAFLVGFIFAQHEQCTPDESLSLAAYAAMSNIMAIGGHGGMLDRHQLLSYLAKLRTANTR